MVCHEGSSIHVGSVRVVHLAILIEDIDYNTKDLFEAHGAHVDTKFLVIANVNWSNIDNWESGSLFGRVLEDSLVEDTWGVHAAVLDDLVGFGTFGGEFDSVGSQ